MTPGGPADGTPDLAAEVVRRVDAEYPRAAGDAIRRRLHGAAADSASLQLAILDLAGGDRVELDDWCDIAALDFRDVRFAHQRWRERRRPPAR